MTAGYSGRSLVDKLGINLRSSSGFIHRFARLRNELAADFHRGSKRG
jgi:hypothetical protein